MIREEALADRAELMLYLLLANYQSGRFADLVRLIPEFEAVARKAGHPELLVWSAVHSECYQLNLTGDLRAFLEHMEIRAPPRRSGAVVFLLMMAAARLHLGDTEHALAQLASAVAEPAAPLQRGCRSPAL